MSTHFAVITPGILSLLQDAGRFGKHQIGLTTGGPLDPIAFHWANRLVENKPGSTVIEASIGALKLKAETDTRIALTGAEMPFTINGEVKAMWRTHCVKSGDIIELAFCKQGDDQQGCRAYLAVSGGFNVEPSFGSTATVVRESLGGLNGAALKAGDTLECGSDHSEQLWQVPASERPSYSNEITLRVIPGYQDSTFSRVQQRLFFSNGFTVSDRCDRMGYRLTGPEVTSDIEGILSEGICLGAIQVPADGQPIVLMNDRQTIGGYPKIGSVLSLDLCKLAQLLPGGKVNFEPITIDCAHNALNLSHSCFQKAQLEAVDGGANDE